MATNKPISAFPTLSAANVQPADELVIVDVSDTSSASTGTTKHITTGDILNNPNNGTVTGQFVPQLGTASAGKIVKTAQNGMVFQSSGGTLTDFSLLSASGLFIAGGRATDEALLGGKLVGIGAVPTVVVGGSSGTGATVSIVGSNTAGIVTLVTGTGVSAGVQWILTFSNPYVGAAVGQVTYSYPDTSVNNYPPIGSSTTITALSLATLGTAVFSDSTSYKFNYQVIGYGN